MALLCGRYVMYGDFCVGKPAGNCWRIRAQSSRNLPAHSIDAALGQQTCGLPRRFPKTKRVKLIMRKFSYCYVVTVSSQTHDSVVSLHNKYAYICDRLDSGCLKEFSQYNFVFWSVRCQWKLYFPFLYTEHNNGNNEKEGFLLSFQKEETCKIKKGKMLLTKQASTQAIPFLKEIRWPHHCHEVLNCFDFRN